MFLVNIPRGLLCSEGKTGGVDRGGWGSGEKGKRKEGETEGGMLLY